MNFILVLASTSPFRRQLLSEAGIAVQAIDPEVDEYQIQAVTPLVLAEKRALAKAEAGARKLLERRDGQSYLVLGADQVLDFGGTSYDKVTSAAAARQRLQTLAGQQHVLHSAFALAQVNAGSVSTVSEKVVSIPMVMKALSEAEIDAYVATGEWQGTVGAYRAEGEGKKLFSTMAGSTSAIVGLPLEVLQNELKRLHPL